MLTNNWVNKLFTKFYYFVWIYNSRNLHIVNYPNLKLLQKKMTEFPKLFIPGPTYVPEHVMKNFSLPQIGHRTAELSALIETIVEGIQKILYTNNHIYTVSHAATGLWEMGIRNSVKHGILHSVNGAFSAKWASMSKECGCNTGILDYKWGQGIKLDDLDTYLSTGKYDVFAMVHNETSTGVMSPLKPIAELLRTKYPDIIWLVDAVSSMAGHRIKVDNLGIDFILSSTQKAWGLPAGFSICAISDRMIERAKSIRNKGYFFDIGAYEKYYKKKQTPTTPSIPHMYGLRYVLNQINKEGLEVRWQRHLNMADYSRKWALERGQSIFPDRGYESSTITCIRNDQEWDIKQINEKLLERGYRMDMGYGKLKGRAFRIAHMGNIMMDDLVDYLNNFDEVINV